MSALRYESPVLRVGEFAFEPGEVLPHPGRVTVLLGPNGGGKTTALRLAAGLAAPGSGRVALGGVAVHAMSAPERARAVAMVVQRPQVSAPFTALEVVALGAAAAGAGPCSAEQALRAVRLSGRADVPFAQMSGGEQQRVAVARAFHQHRPGGVLLLDEAFAAVDPPEAASIVAAVRSRAAAGATVLVATHDLALASALADDAWFVAGGRTAAFGPAMDLLAPEVLGAFLGVKVTAATGARGPVAAADLADRLPPESP